MAQYEYTATLPDGVVITRKSNRDYEYVVAGYAGPKWREFHAAQYRKDIARMKHEIEHNADMLSRLHMDKVDWVKRYEDRLADVLATDMWISVGFAGNSTLAASYVSRESKPSRGGFIWDDVKAIKVERREIIKRIKK